MTATTKKKLLIVDDESHIRELYKAEFDMEGYEVVLASSGPEALSMIENSKPDLVVLDIRMPGMDGIEAMGEILGRDNELPVIINSAYSHYKENFMSWSADAYIVKSADLTELKAKVAELLNRGIE